MSARRIFLIRHAQSEKNVEDRHGGPGRAITEMGYRELDKLVAFLKIQEVCCSTIFYCPVSQAKITAQYLSIDLNAVCQPDVRIQSLNLGVLAGLSRTEAVALYPEPAQRLEEWRQGKLMINDLNIPEMEHFNKFWERGHLFLEDHLLHSGEEGDLVVIGTRSILILLLNILLRNTILKGKPYAVFDFDNCGVSILRHIKELDAELICHNKIDFLVNSATK